LLFLTFKFVLEDVKMSKLLVTMVLILGVGSMAIAAPVPALWLKADGLSGTTVPVWNDSSPSGVVMQRLPDLAPGSESATDPANHTPQLLTGVTNGSATFNAVQFRQAYDPVSPDPVAGHQADWLYQTPASLGAGDPLAIGGDVTIFVVNKSYALHGETGGLVNMVGLRGPGGAPYTLCTAGNASGIRPGLVTYGGDVVYYSTLPRNNTIQYGIYEMKMADAGAGNSNVTFSQIFTSSGVWQDSTILIPKNAGTGGDVISGQPNAPFGIAGHAQGAAGSPAAPYGNGQYERWAGEIPEIFIFNGALAGADEAGIRNYLAAKYAIPEPATMTLLGLGALALIKRRRA